VNAEPGDAEIDLVVDVANVMGSRPDGWWRDRAGAAERLGRALAALPGQSVAVPEGATPGGVGVRLRHVHAVVEGQARRAADPAAAGVTVVRAPADGDTAIVEVCADLLGAGRRPLAVTADRGLRARLPAGTALAGPRWLLDLLP
jgi:hypothetical protein